ncbi:MobF family relaxase [Arsenophonus nasoniae]|uniref:MobF family relaxase n=1 Tax=Arsenophonus nasoniae TaxID=638 RepID=UPI00041C1B2B|nr:MobF family relaxase [Arsenophonus nasoniae]
MLSVKNLTSGGASASANYYEEKDNYYFVGEEGTGWFGKGAERLGLTGTVDRNTFEQMLEGKLPDGTQLSFNKTGKNQHRPGYDLTFSAPKSVSVLALVEGNTAVLDAHKKAVASALKEIENISSTRTMTKGVTQTEMTSNTIAALFMHTTNRNLDPNLHTHALLINATWSDKKGWKTLSSDTINRNGFNEIIRDLQITFGSIYRQHLKESLQKQGYSFISTGKNGLWEIEGVPTEPFSSRRKEVVEAVGETASAKQKSAAVLATRKAKTFTNVETLHKEWQARLAKTGYSADNVKKAENLNPSTPMVNLKEAISQSIKVLSDKNTRFSYDALLTHVINRIPCQPKVLETLRKEINQAIKQGSIVPLNSESTLLTTENHLKQENAVSTLIHQLRYSKHELTTAQESALAKNITQNNVRFNLVNLKGGFTHEIQVIEELHGLAKENKLNTVIITPNKKISDKLQEQVNKKVKTISIDDYLNAPHKNNNKRQLIGIYQSEHLPLNKVAALLSRSYTEGDTIIALDSASRKNKGLTSEIARALGTEPINAFESNADKHLYFVPEQDKTSRIQTAANHFANFYALNKDVIIQAGNNPTKEAITTKTREVLIEKGLLSENKMVVATKKSIFLDAANRNQRSTYNIGMILERTTENERQQYQIKSISKQSNKLLLQDSAGNTSALSINKIDSHYRLFKVQEMELREGDRVKSTGVFGQNIQAGKTFTITELKKGNFLFADKIIMEDEYGKKASFTPKADSKLEYHYCEAFGNSLDKNQTVIAVFNEKEVNNLTINQIRRSGKNIIGITGLDSDSIQKRLQQSEISTTVLSDIQQGDESFLKAAEVAKNNATPDIQKQLNIAIDRRTKSSMVFNSLDVITDAAKSSNFTFNDCINAFKQRLKKGEVKCVDETTHEFYGRFIRKEDFDNEVKILTQILQGKNSQLPLIQNKEKLHFTGLTQGQQKAAKLVLTSKDQTIMIQGYAGVGKTTQFKTVAQALNDNRPDVNIVGLAPTHKAVNELQAAGIKSQTIASFLMEKHQNNLKTSYKNTLFVIDESSMIGNKTLAELLLNITDNAGRVVLSGDAKQLKAFERGAPFALAWQRSAADKVVMDEIVRQTPELKPAIEAIIAGNTQKSLDIIRQVSPDRVARNNGAFIPESAIMKGDSSGKPQENDNQMIKMVIDDYVGREKEARDNTVIITPLNADRNQLNENIHAVMQSQQMLGKSAIIPVLQRINHQEADLKDSQFWQNQLGHIAKINQHYFQITGVSKEGIVGLINRENNQEKYLSPLEVNPAVVALFEDKTIEVSEGEKIRLTTTDKDRNIANNDRGMIKRIEGDKLYIELNGKLVTYQPQKEYADRHLDYTYAITSYASQGASYPYVIVYEGSRTIAAMDNTYVELSRAKAHVQIYLRDGDAWMEALTKNSGDRLTAHDILNKQEDQLARNEIRIWDNSKEIGNTKLAQKIEPSLLEVARFSHHDRPELLLPVNNEHGIQRGNLHIPVGVYTGKVNIEEATYKGASDGLYIVLNKGNDENSINLYSLSQFDEALKKDTKDHSIVIELDNTNIPINEIPESLPQDREIEKINENQDITLESALLHDDEKIPDLQLAEESPTREKENEEINISYHHEEEQKQKIKEKEYGD